MRNRRSVSDEELLALLEAAIMEAPEFLYGATLGDSELRWLGRAEALIEASDDIPSTVDFRFARKSIGSYKHSRSALLAPLHAAYARIELRAPKALRGAFIPAGDTWNGFAAIVNVLRNGAEDIFVVDPYLNASFFLDFAPLCQTQSNVRCLTSQRPENHEGLLAAIRHWLAADPKERARVEVRYAPKSALHDRMIISGSDVWLLSQSIKDIAKRSPASVSKADPELSQMKKDHYSELWLASNEPS